MGEYSHQALIVVVPPHCSVRELLAEMDEIASELSAVSGPDERQLMSLVTSVPCAVNGGSTVVVVAPDGSKAGWPEQERAAVFRDRVVDLLESKRYEDGSLSYSYAHVAIKGSSGMEPTTLLATSDRADLPLD